MQQRSELRTNGQASRLTGKRIVGRAVGSFLPGLTRKAFEKYGFSTATLLTDWAAIAGDELAAYTVPERLAWPKSAGAPEEDGTDGRGRSGAKLVLRVDTARVLDVEYRKHQIIERINAHFGYRAVGELRFVQAPVRQPVQPQRRVAGSGDGLTASHERKPRDLLLTAASAPGPAAPWAALAVNSGQPPELEAALARLGASILARQA